MSQNSQFLYLDSLGWKTAKPHKIEIWFVENEKKYYIVSERKKKAHWVQNIMHHPNVSFTVNSRKFGGHARVIDDKESELITTVSSLMNKKYGWSDGLIIELDPL
jgi:deazaflavin-dependent oxidoreductase (nitroreductase family)